MQITCILSLAECFLFSFLWPLKSFLRRIECAHQTRKDFPIDSPSSMSAFNPLLLGKITSSLASAFYKNFTKIVNFKLFSFVFKTLQTSFHWNWFFSARNWIFKTRNSSKISQSLFFGAKKERYFCAIVFMKCKTQFYAVRYFLIRYWSRRWWNRDWTWFLETAIFNSRGEKAAWNEQKIKKKKLDRLCFTFAINV